MTDGFRERIRFRSGCRRRGGGSDVGRLGEGIAGDGRVGRFEDRGDLWFFDRSRCGCCRRRGGADDADTEILANDGRQRS